MDKELVTIYCDGACQNKYAGDGSNRGGWCAILQYGGKEKIVSGSDTNTTNNRMEIMPLCECLPNILNRGYKNIKIITDSMYVIYGIRGIKKWPKKKNLPNKDLWIPLYKIIEYHDAKIDTEWVKGHSGHTENERCNEIAEQRSTKQFDKLYGW
jgi:ribonuclease HI